MSAWKLVAVFAVVLFAFGCADDDEGGSFELDFIGTTFAGTDVDCRINTSYPEGDPQRDRFYVRAANPEEQNFSALISFLAHTDAPPAGDYGFGDLAIQAGFDGLSGEYVRGDFSDGGTVTVVDDGSGSLTITIAGSSTMTGTIVCP